MNSHGFASAIGLEKISIGPRGRCRPAYVSTKSNPKCESGLVELLKKFKDCFSWPGLINCLNFEEF